MKSFLWIPVVAFIAMNSLFAQTVDVKYDVTGSAGDWTLNFHVSNNTLPGDMSIYFFGVKLDARDIVGSPPSWDPNTWTSWDNSAYGGSSTIYNNNWIDLAFDANMVQPGETLDGFKAHTTVTDMPTSVPYFLFAVSFTGYEYYGDDAFNDGWNPGFEGKATIIPEPMSIAALGMGVLLLLRRKKA
ncbi:MAG TPA: PEP-CTERM sorting domain-containing protein [Fimbriimonadales bacterium]|nr:PEP-CTERM sorting domain-containing protein [Fimbriimonadales bacterium]